VIPAVSNFLTSLALIMVAEVEARVVITKMEDRIEDWKAGRFPSPANSQSCSTSGEEALDRLVEDIQPAIVAVPSDININIPGMDGLQLLSEIKQRCPDLPVLMVTVYSDDERSVPFPSDRQPRRAPPQCNQSGPG
jgi:CheY-like chemotaxis protein